MKERPILFSTPMVQAILEGRKTQTRRVVKQKHLPFVENLLGGFLNGKWNQRPLPYGKKGDHLWVRETFTKIEPNILLYRADEMFDGMEAGDFGWSWKPSIFMPRAASRITLEVTNVRVERLQDISEADAVAEGIEKLGNILLWTYKNYSDAPKNRQLSAVESYQTLWESINGAGSWNLNPWVWVVEFRRIK